MWKAIAVMGPMVGRMGVAGVKRVGCGEGRLLGRLKKEEGSVRECKGSFKNGVVYPFFGITFKKGYPQFPFWRLHPLLS
jgi:hypothetical protein